MSPRRQVASPLPAAGIDVGALVIRLTDELSGVSVTIDDRLVEVGEGGVREILIGNVPAGTHTIRIAGSQRGAPLDETREVTITAGDTTTALVAVPGGFWMAEHWYWMIIVPVVMVVLDSSH